MNQNPDDEARQIAELEWIVITHQAELEYKRERYEVGRLVSANA